MVPNDIQIYCNCMDRVRHHVSVADTVFAGGINVGDADLNTELIFLHLRKAVEEIAFASLSANREKYSAVRAEFARDWNARTMLHFIGKFVNPNFYPVPVMPPLEIAPGRKFLDRVANGFLTKTDFVSLYNSSSRVLHARNPYSPNKNAPLTFKYTVDGWSNRIKALLSWHFVQLVDVQGLWVFSVPNQGAVEAWPLAADGPFVVEPP